MAANQADMIRCPKCGKRLKTGFSDTVCVQQNPTLREKLLSEEFFRCSCKNCGYEGSVLARCLYHDEAHGFMLYLLPDFNGGVLLDEQTERRFPELADTRKRVVTSVNAMKEKILLLEAGMDDRAVELAKLGVAELIARRNGRKIREAYFTELDEAQHRMCFSFYLDDDSTPRQCRTRSDIYTVSQSIVREEAARFPVRGFLKIDFRWAARVLAAYRNPTPEQGERKGVKAGCL